jgi:peroxiredoxin
MAHQPKSQPLSIGAKAPEFSLQGTDGKEHTLSKAKGTKGTVVAFSCNHCPYVKAYDARMNALAREYESKGIAWFVINSNDTTNHPDDSFAKMQDKARELQLAYPYLRDETQQVASDYGAGCTPEFFLFNADLNLVYTGRLDDNMENEEAIESRYLHNACEAVLAGKAPETAKTHPIGCSVKWRG